MMVATRRVNEVAEVACRENCSNPPDVTSITTKASRPAVLAVMTTNPGFDGAVKTPCWLTEPVVVFQATVAPVTALPNWSVTMAPKSRVPPTATVVAGASMAIPTGGPATSVTVIVRETVPSVAVSCTDAGVVVMGAWYRMVRPSGVSSKMLPVPVVVHRTSPSGFALPYASRAVAAITDWESTDRLVGAGAAGALPGRAQPRLRGPGRALHPDRVVERVERARLQDTGFADLATRSVARHDHRADPPGPHAAKGVHGARVLLQPDPAPLN